jgi:hypothetical protein
MANIRERSGQIDSGDPLVSFLYVLMRDHLPTGVVAELVTSCELLGDDHQAQLSNGWLAEYAKDLAKRLQP